MVRSRPAPFRLLALDDRIVPSVTIDPPPMTDPEAEQLAADGIMMTTTSAATTSAAPLNPAFGENGVATLAPTTDFGGTPRVAKVIGLANGQTLTLATFRYDWFVERRNADGSPDTTFGTNGRALLYTANAPLGVFLIEGAPISYADMVATPDGGVVAVGVEGSVTGVFGPSRLLAKKLTSAGQPDAAFNANADAATAPGFGPAADELMLIGGAALAADGGILVVGSGQMGPISDRDGENVRKGGVLKLRADGTRDTAFGTGGGVVFDGTGITPSVPDGGPLRTEATKVTVDAAGRVLVLGTGVPSQIAVLAYVGADTGVRPFVARLTPTGQLDTSFAGDGIADLRAPSLNPPNGALPIGESFVTAFDLAAAPGGAVLVGLNDRRGFDTNGLVYRLTPGGTMDPGYGTNGVANIADGRGLSDLAAGADGSAILVTGSDNSRNPLADVAPTSTLSVYRLSSTGAVTALGDLPAVGNAIAVDAAGRVTVGAVNDASAAGQSAPPDDRIRLYRLAETLPNRLALLDQSFGLNGIVSIPAGVPTLSGPTVRKVIGLANGQTLVLATFQYDWFVERRNADGTLDTTFGTNGRALLTDTGLTPGVPIPDLPETTFTDLAVTPDGGVVAVGYITPGFAPPDTPNFLLVRRLTRDGRTDTAFQTKAAATFTALVNPAEAANRYSRPVSVAVLSDGSVGVLMAGLYDPAVAAQAPAAQRAAVVRLKPDGTADAGFGTNGVAFLSGTAGFATDRLSNLFGAVSVEPVRLAVDVNGRLLVIGDTGVSLRPGVAIDSTERFPGGSRPFVARLTAAGRLDTTFAGDGVAEVTVPPRLITTDAPPGFDATNLSLADAALTSDGGVLLLVTDRRLYNAQSVLARVTVNGTLDTAYGTGGFVTVDDARGLIGLALTGDDTATAVTGAELNRNPAASQLPVQTAGVYRISPTGMVNKLGEIDDGDRTSRQVGQAVGIDSAGRVTVGLSYFAQPETVTTIPDPASKAAVQLARLSANPPVTGPPVALAGGNNGRLEQLALTSAGELVVTGEVTPFVGYSGRVRGMTVDLNKDGFADTVFVTGPGGGSRVRVEFGQDPRIAAPQSPVVQEFSAFEDRFTGGVWVTAADLTGDGVLDVIVTPDLGGGPVVAVYDGAKLATRGVTPTPMLRFFGIDDPAYRGGARAAAADTDGDGKPELVVTAGAGGGPRVATYDGRSLAGTPRLLRPDFFAFESSLRSGVSVAAGDLNGDGKAELIFSSAAGGSARVRVMSGETPRADFFAGNDPSGRGGATVAVRGGRLFVGSGGMVRTYTDPTGGGPAAVSELAVAPDPTGGVFVG